MKSVFKIAVFALMPIFGFAQSNNVQSAWRAFEEYKSTVQDGKPDIDYLNKAKEKIDLAQSNPDTKDKPKTLTYVCKIYYSFFQYNWGEEKKKLATTITNKTEAAEIAYGNVSSKEFEIAGDALQKVFVSESALKEKPYTMELAQFAMNMLSDMQNLAVGRFKMKKYDEAMEIFYDTYTAYKTIGRKDTSLIYNAIVAAELGKKYEKVLEYGKVMLSDKVDNEGTWNKIHFAYLSLQDTANAEKTLKDGLALFPNDKALILNYINICLQQKKQAVAMTYIDKAIEKDPKNCALFLVLGNIFDTEANSPVLRIGMTRTELSKMLGSPKEVQKTTLEGHAFETWTYQKHSIQLDNDNVSLITGETNLSTKPNNFEELMKKSEEAYLKAINCDSTGFDANFNLGAVYNNWGSWYAAKADVKHPEFDKKAQEYWLKAVTYLEAADKVKPCEKGVMFNLIRLYRTTDQAQKSTEMSAKMKNGCK